jgi:polar amino acid transport system permease protein
MNDIISDWPTFFPEFLPGLWVTLRLTLCALLIGLPLGAFFAVLSDSPFKPVRVSTITVVELGRGTPGLIVLYIAYFGMPQVGVVLSAFVAAAVGLGFTTAAYTSEIIRAGIRSIPAGQREAGAALSLTQWQELRLVVLPQALRKVIPPLIGFGILLFQGTSLAYAISVPELLSKAYNIATLTYQFTSALLLAGFMYSVITLTITVGAGTRVRPT